MNTRILSAIGVATGLLAAQGDAFGVFLGLQIREDKTLAPAPNLPSGLRVFNFYAKFDGVGTASGPGVVNRVIAVGSETPLQTFGIDLGRNPGANFFQASALDGASANNVGGPDLSFENPRGLYDTWVSVGMKYQDSVNEMIDGSFNDPNFAFSNTDGVSGPASLGLGAGQDHIRAGWYRPIDMPLQGAAESVNGKFEVFLAQIAVAGLAPGTSVDVGHSNAALTWVNDIFTGSFTLYRQGNTAIGENAAIGYTITMTTLPTPGGAGVVFIAGLLGMRRRAR